jgi:peptidyl-prolyl cis-trans isomerase D
VLQTMRARAKWVWLFIVVFFVGGFLFLDTSGLLGTAPITAGTTVASVNGVEIPYVTYENTRQNLGRQQESQLGRGLTLDEWKRVGDQAFEQLVSSVLLDQEYRRRGITVTDAEIIAASQSSPPPELMSNPELQTDGQFDIEKYQRLLRSPAARQQGLLQQLEQYYRNEIPRAKLFDQLVSDVYVSDAKLWSSFKDLRDSAQVSYVTFDATAVPDSQVSVPENEMRAYYDANEERFERPGRAVVSLLTIPRSITATDTTAARARAVALREEIVGGAKFEDVAKRESADTVSGADGGSLGRGARGRFVAPFEEAAYALRPGEISQPVSTPFGFHIIKVDERKGDTLALRHILVRVTQSDSSATRTDRRADSLVKIAASQTEPARFDSAAKVLKLTPESAIAFEGEPLFAAGRQVPSVSAWAFQGVQPGETSELFDSDEAYYLARIDSVTAGGVAPFATVREEIRQTLSMKKKAESLVPRATEFAKAAAASSLEQAAQSRDITVGKTEMFSRPMFVTGLGRMNAAIGAAFTLPIGVVSAPIRTDQGVNVVRVDRRVQADSAAWDAQKDQQRREALQGLRQQRVRFYLEALRRNAEVEDNRKDIEASARAQAVAAP